MVRFHLFQPILTIICRLNVKESLNTKVNYLGRIEDEDILNLSKTQRDILLLMEKHKLYLVHTEGESVECWLENDKKQKIKRVRKSTVNVLINKKILYYSNDISLKKTRRIHYYHVLSQDYLQKLNRLRERNRVY